MFPTLSFEASLRPEQGYLRVVWTKRGVFDFEQSFPRIELEDVMDRQAKTSTGQNDRQKNETIAGSGPGISDDSGGMVELTDEEIELTKNRLRDRLDDLKDQLDEQISLSQKVAP
jgi:hypothetical protein